MVKIRRACEVLFLGLFLFFLVITGPFLSHATVRAIRVRETGDWRLKQKVKAPAGERVQ